MCVIVCNTSCESAISALTLVKISFHIFLLKMAKLISEETRSTSFYRLCNIPLRYTLY